MMANISSSGQTPQMIAQGDYSEFVDKQIEKLLDDNPDAQAIVFANDEMAFSGYRVCEQRGLKVGKDILITGFDDCERASGMEPPLTTVQQDGVLMGKMAVYDLDSQTGGQGMFCPEEFLFLYVSENPAAARNSFRKSAVLL